MGARSSLPSLSSMSSFCHRRDLGAFGCQGQPAKLVINVIAGILATSKSQARAYPETRMSPHVTQPAKLVTPRHRLSVTAGLQGFGTVFWHASMSPFCPGGRAPAPEGRPGGRLQNPPGQQLPVHGPGPVLYSTDAALGALNSTLLPEGAYTGARRPPGSAPTLPPPPTARPRTA